MKEKISILGCGWLGLPLAENFIASGFSVQGSTTSKDKIQLLLEKEIKPYLINLSNLQTNLSSFLNTDILIINIPFFDFEIFEKLVSHINKSRVSRVIFISSTSVYKNSSETITEESETKDIPLSKIENLFISNSNFKTTVIRFAGLIGYNRKPSNFFPKGVTIKNPEGVINMIHRDDCVKIIEEVINQNLWGDILNGCSSSHPVRRTFYSRAYINSGREVPAFIENEAIIIKKISNQKLISKLSFVFKYPDILSCV